MYVCLKSCRNSCESFCGARFAVSIGSARPKVVTYVRLMLCLNCVTRDAALLSLSSNEASVL